MSSLLAECLAWIPWLAVFSRAGHRGKAHSAHSQLPPCCCARAWGVSLSPGPWSPGSLDGSGMCICPHVFLAFAGLGAGGLGSPDGEEALGAT